VVLLLRNLKAKPLAVNGGGGFGEFGFFISCFFLCVYYYLMASCVLIGVLHFGMKKSCLV